MKCKAITATDDSLIVHEFDSEEDALLTIPFIKRWKRHTEWLDDGVIRYHSKQAEKYWRKQKLKDKIKGVIITRDDKGKKHYKYY